MNLCDFGLFAVILSWLLPFLLGILFGYGVWAKFKKKSEELEKKVANLNSEIQEKENTIEAQHKHKLDLDSEIALIKGQIREKNAYIKSVEADIENLKKKKK